MVTKPARKMVRKVSRAPQGVAESVKGLIPAESVTKHVPDAEELALWDKHRKGDAEARNALAEKYYSLVDVNAANAIEALLRAIEENDLKQAAMVGFLESLEEFRSVQGMEFAEYSSLRIRQAIMDEVCNYIRE